MTLKLYPHIRECCLLTAESLMFKQFISLPVSAELAAIVEMVIAQVELQNWVTTIMKLLKYISHDFNIDVYKTIFQSFYHCDDRLW